MIKFLPFSLLKSLEVIVNIMEEEGTKILSKQQKDLANEVEEDDVKDIISILREDNRPYYISRY